MLLPLEVQRKMMFHSKYFGGIARERSVIRVVIRAEISNI